MQDIMQLCDLVRETGFAIHRYHKHGHLEKVYEHGLLINFGAPKFEIKRYVLSRIDQEGRHGALLGGIISLFASFALFRGYLNSGF